jgi:hypothetical protein
VTQVTHFSLEGWKMNIGLLGIGEEGVN